MDHSITMDCNVNVFFKTVSEHCMSRDNMKSINMKKLSAHSKNKMQFQKRKCMRRKTNLNSSNRQTRSMPNQLSHAHTQTHHSENELSENAICLTKKILPVVKFQIELRLSMAHQLQVKNVVIEYTSTSLCSSDPL